MKISQRVSELQTQTVGLTLGWLKFTKGHNSVKNCRWSYGTSAHRLYICTKFQENISQGFRVIELMLFVY